MNTGEMDCSLQLQIVFKNQFGRSNAKAYWISNTKKLKMRATYAYAVGWSRLLREVENFCKGYAIKVLRSGLNQRTVLIEFNSLDDAVKTMMDQGMRRLYLRSMVVQYAKLELSKLVNKFDLPCNNQTCYILRK